MDGQAQHVRGDGGRVGGEGDLHGDVGQQAGDGGLVETVVVGGGVEREEVVALGGVVRQRHVDGMDGTPADTHKVGGGGVGALEPLQVDGDVGPGGGGQVEVVLGKQGRGGDSSRPTARPGVQGEQEGLGVGVHKAEPEQQPPAEACGRHWAVWWAAAEEDTLPSRCTQASVWDALWCSNTRAKRSVATITSATR